MVNGIQLPDSPEKSFVVVCTRLSIYD